MNIVFLVSALGPGGAERVATLLCNEWAKRGDTVTIVQTFSGNREIFYPLSDSVNLLSLGQPVDKKRIFSQSKRLFKLRTIIKESKPDVVISFLSNVNVAAILATFFTNIPVICCERRTPSSSPLSKGWEFACRLTYPYADMVTGQTIDTVNEIPKIYPGTACVRVIHNPMSENIFKTVRTHESNENKILLSLSRLVKRKQINVLIEIFSEIAEDFPDWQLHIYGDGPERNELIKQIAELSLSQRILIMGETDKAWDIMANSDIYLMASRSEGMPNTLLEAMAVGIPCIVFDCPNGPNEVTQNGQDAMLVPLNNKTLYKQALIELMKNESVRQQLGEKAKCSVYRRYNMSTVIAEWDALFRELAIEV